MIDQSCDRHGQWPWRSQLEKTGVDLEFVLRDAVTWQFCDSVICCFAVGGLCPVWLGLQCTPSRLNSALCPKLHPLTFTCCHSPGRLDRANYIAQIILISVHKYEFTGHKCRGRALPRNLASVASFAKKQILLPLLLSDAPSFFWVVIIFFLAVWFSLESAKR